MSASAVGTTQAVSEDGLEDCGPQPVSKLEVSF